jgi:hypothetical protein
MGGEIRISSSRRFTAFTLDLPPALENAGTGSAAALARSSA